MRIETLLFKEIVILPELFLGISLVYLVLHCTFLAIQKNYLLIQNSVLYLGILVLFLACFLVLNDGLEVLELSFLNDTIIHDYVSFSSKLVIGSLSLFCLLMIQPYLTSQKINHFEYILLILFSVLGLFLLCSSNDLLTAYLAIELQSLAFYVLASFKKILPFLLMQVLNILFWVLFLRVYFYLVRRCYMGSPGPLILKNLKTCL